MKLHEVVVDRSHDGRVARLRLPGGDLGARAAAELSAAAADLVEDRDVRVAVLDASGSDFCSGPHPSLDRVALSPDPASAIARLRVPVIGGLGGRCMSVGVELALCCDIRVASPGAVFRCDDLARGVVPAWGGTQRLPRAVGTGRASAMLLLGTEIDAATALEWGLVHAVGDLDAQIDAMVEQLLGTGPLALEFAKEAVHRGSELPLRDGLRLEGDLNHQLAATDDRAEGIAAFFEKRPPDFSGR